MWLNNVKIAKKSNRLDGGIYVIRVTKDKEVEGDSQKYMPIQSNTPNIKRNLLNEQGKGDSLILNCENVNAKLVKIGTRKIRGIDRSIGGNTTRTPKIITLTGRAFENLEKIILRLGKGLKGLAKFAQNQNTRTENSDSTFITRMQTGKTTQWQILWLCVLFVIES
jgi:hypothetical protein